MPIICSDKDAQMCIYHISWQSNFGFCCELDEECAQELTGNVLFLMAILDIILYSSLGSYANLTICRCSWCFICSAGCKL